MKQLLIEAICHGCELIVYSTVFYEDCVHYCPECGERLNVTGEKYQLQTNNIQAKYYFSREQLQRRVIALRKKGWTIREIAAELGINRMTVFRMINHKVIVASVSEPEENQQVLLGYPGSNERIVERIPEMMEAASSSNPTTTPTLTGNKKNNLMTNPQGLSK